MDRGFNRQFISKSDNFSTKGFQFKWSSFRNISLHRRSGSWFKTLSHFHSALNGTCLELDSVGDSHILNFAHGFHEDLTSSLKLINLTCIRTRQSSNPSKE